MSQAYTNLLTHIVFSTKQRLALIDERIKSELHAYLGGLIKELGGKPYIINGTSDHVHLLVSLPPKIALSDAVRFIKSNSTNFVKQKFGNEKFSWQGGYGAFSVSRSQSKNVIGYIQNQEEHHRKFDFRQEFELMLEKNEVEHDARYVWN